MSRAVAVFKRVEMFWPPSMLELTPQWKAEAHASSHWSSLCICVRVVALTLRSIFRMPNCKSFIDAVG